MSRLNSSQQNGTGLQGMIKRIGATIREQGNAFASPDHTKQVLAMESIGEAEFDGVSRRFNEISNELRGLWTECLGYGKDAKKLGLEGIAPTEAQLEAGAIAALAAGSPVDYATRAYTNVHAVASNANMRVSEAAMTHGLVPAMEAFNESELKSYLAFSVAFNVMAARQGEFAERFYPTVVVTPDQAGLDITVRRTMVLNEIRHQLSGTPTDFNRKNLIDAVIDPTILANESNVLIPVVINTVGSPDNNAQFFVAPGDVAPYNLTTDAGQTVLTAPLIVGQTVDLLGISQRNDIQIQGQFDITDQIDPRVMLGKIYLKFVTTGTTPVTSVVPIDVTRYPRTQYVKTQEGNYKELMLNFVTTSIPLTALTKDITGANAAAVVAGLGAITAPAGSTLLVRLGLTVGGSAQVEFGNISAQPSNVSIQKIYSVDALGNQTDITTAIFSGTTTNQQQLASEFASMQMIGYDPVATRSNLNRRTRGLLMETTDYTDRYTIALTAPVTMPSPVGSNRDTSDMTTLINAVRIRNDNLAITTMLSYRDALSVLNAAPEFSIPVPDIEGMGRYLVRPFYEFQNLDVLASINNIMTKDRIKDVQATIVNAIRDVAYRMYQQSGYQPALDSMTGGSGERPIVLIGTDSVIAKYLLVDGDTRTLGLALDSEVVVSLDERMWGQIVVTLTRATQNGADPLCFGQMAWIPELASTVQVTRNGSTVKETMVQPRMRHINNLPVMAWFNVENLDQAITDKISVNTHTV